MDVKEVVSGTTYNSLVNSVLYHNQWSPVLMDQCILNQPLEDNTCISRTGEHFGNRACNNYVIPRQSSGVSSRAQSRKKGILQTNNYMKCSPTNFSQSPCSKGKPAPALGVEGGRGISIVLCSLCGRKKILKTSSMSHNAQ